MNRKHSMIIIGGGMTGLSAGLTWALNNDVRQKPVCLLEKQRVLGGSVTTYTRKGYAFDTCQMISNLAPVFSYFGLNTQFKEFHGNFGRVCLADPSSGKAKIIELPSGEERFKQQICSRYPQAAEKFTRFFEYSRAMFRELYALKYAPNLWEIMKTVFNCPRIIRHAHETFEQYLEHFDLPEPEIREILRPFVSMSGLPESQVAALLPVGVMFSLLEKAFRPAGPFIDLPRQMAARFQALGGEVRLDAEVEKIIIEQGCVRGVRLRTGEFLAGDLVITTVDVQRAMQDLVGMETLAAADAKYARQVQNLRMTASTLTVNLGLDEQLDLGALGLAGGYTMLTTGGDTFERIFAAAEQQETVYSEQCFHLGVICPSQVTGGQPVITISVFPMPLGQWAIWREQDPQTYQRQKQAWGELFVRLVEKYLIPGLQQHIRVIDISTPATYARYSGSPSGAIYDMASVPENFGLKRLSMRTPIRGLYQPKFSHGVFGSVMQGMQVIDLIMNRKIMNGNSRFGQKG